MRTLRAVVVLLLCAPAFSQTYDVVIRGGRVLDPETGLDAVRDVGIAGEKIARISESPLTGKRTIAVRVGVAPARKLYAGCLGGALVAVAIAAAFEPYALLALLAAPLAVRPVRNVMTRSDPPSLIASLVGTVRFQLALAVLLATAFWIS